jgi:DNA polymerase
MTGLQAARRALESEDYVVLRKGGKLDYAHRKAILVNWSIAVNRFGRDAETRSELNLAEVGPDVYMRHPSTTVLCVATFWNDEAIEIWVPGMPIPPAANKAHQDPTCQVLSHNDRFESLVEQVILSPRFGWPTTPKRQHRCTLTEALALSLPASLDLLAEVLKLKHRKDRDGHALMMRMSRPLSRRRSDTAVHWNEDADDLQRLCRYAAIDAEVLRELAERLTPLSELPLWLLDAEINERGVHVDLDLVRAMAAVAQEASLELDAELADRTDGQVLRTTQFARQKTWVAARGVAAASLAKDALAELLQADLPPGVHRVLQLRQLGSLTSLAKLERLLASVSADGRLRHSYQFHAASTGRWGGSNVQTQNLPRPTPSDLREHGKSIAAEVDDDMIESAVTLLGTGQLSGVRDRYVDPLSTIRSTLRALFIAGPGNTLLGGDFSAIEARTLAWFAGEEWKLAAFRAKEDIYRVLGAKMSGLLVGEVSKSSPARGSGKVGELAFGFGGSVGAWRRFQLPSMQDYTDEQVIQFRDSWRKKNPAIVKLWGTIDRAARRALLERNAGIPMPVARGAAFVKRGPDLKLILPSGRELSYPQARLIADRNRRGKVVVTFKDTSKKGRFEDVRGGDGAWFGLLTENLVSATARDLLAAAMIRLDAAGFPIVMHTHDEVVVELPATTNRLDEFEKVMSEVPPWADGLPIAVDVWSGLRYRK